MFGWFLTVVEALTWVTVTGALLSMVIHCPDFPFIANTMPWPIFLGCVATLIIRPILKAIQALFISFRNLVKSPAKNLETPEDVAEQNIETPVDFCWYMASIQVVEMKRFLGGSTLTLRTDGEFCPKTNTIFFKMFGRHPYEPTEKLPDQIKIAKPGGVVFFCDDTSNSWAVALRSEVSKQTGKPMSRITQSDMISCMSKRFLETHDVKRVVPKLGEE